LLHVTNGDAAVERMREGGLRGEFLPWRDVLHDGPVPQTATLAELSAIRVAYLAASGYGEGALIAAEFADRDARLSRYEWFEEIVFWFEHDLYDQLQLLQVLDWMGRQPKLAPVSLIVIGTYPGIDRFVGLGQLSPRQLVGLLDMRIPATPEHFAAAIEGWRAFRQPTPVALAQMLDTEVPALPFLRGAVLRLLEELPSVRNGLSRTERAALGIVSHGTSRPMEILSQLQSLEQRPWLGDWSVWKILRQMAEGAEPLLETADRQPFRHPPMHLDGPGFNDQALSLTRAGREVLENRRDALKLRPVDRWLGGTHLRRGSLWRWDEEKLELVAES
jgi:hypothetical protein